MNTENLINDIYSGIIKIALSFLGVLLVSFPANADFSDVLPDHENYDAIMYVQSEGIVEGYADGDYRPNNNINRAEFTKIIIEAQFDEDTIENCIDQNSQENWNYVFFPDVDEDDWFAKYICVAKIQNIIKGYPDGFYKPGNDINFVEASKIIVNTFGYSVGSDDVWYKPFVEKLGEKKAIPTTITAFSTNITRGEMAEMVYRLKADITTKESLNYEMIEAVETEWQTYQNEEYKFSLIFPDSWAGYYTAKNNIHNYIDFGLREQSSILRILILTKSEWEKIKEGEHFLRYLGENNQYVFVYSHAQDCINQTICERMAEIPSIVSTFELTQTESAEDPYKGWGTYRNEGLGFELKIPSYANVDLELNDAYNRLAVFKGNNEHFEVRLKSGESRISGEPIPLDEYFFLDFPIAFRASLGGEEALVFEAPNGYCDGPGCGAPFVAYSAKHKDSFYNLVFYGDTELTVIEKLIISSFKFID